MGDRTGEGDGGDHSGLEVGILGSVVARRGQVDLDLGPPRQRAVLAMLVLARGDVVPAERIVDELWRGNPTKGATGSLHAWVSRLRSALGRDAILRVGPGYRLALEAEAVDARRFERLLDRSAMDPAAHRVPVLAAALDLWRGPALVAYAGEPWAKAEAVRLDALREVARDRLVAARLDVEDAATLVPELERLVGDQPLREERWRLLALALYRSLRQADALGALRRARETLADELGVDPGPALRSLESDILAHAPSLLAPPVAVAPGQADPAGPRSASRSTPAAASDAGVGPTVPSPPAVPIQGAAASRPEPPAAGGGTSPTGAVAAGPPTDARADDLLERAGELAELGSLLAAATDGAGGFMLIEGSAGIGKSRLLVEARRLAADQGFGVCSARGSRLEREFGYGVVRQLFEDAVRDRGEAVATRLGPAAAVFDLAGADQSAPGEYPVLAGLHRLVADLARQAPLLVAVDDVQWCDPESLQLLSFLVRRVEGLPVLVLATLRTGEAEAWELVLAELAGDGAPAVIRPGPLTIDGVGDIVRHRLGAQAAPAFVAACHRTTGGNPLLVRQLVRGLENGRVRPDEAHVDTVTAIGSRAITSTVLLRLRRLGADAEPVAAAVAVLGDGADVTQVAALSGRPEPDVVAAVGSLARVEILADGNPLAFVHPLVREAVYRDIGPGERELAHERAARIVQAAGRPAEQVASHLMLAPRRGDRSTVDGLVRAARLAEGRRAYSAAATYVARALEEPPEPVQRVRLTTWLGSLTGQVDGRRSAAALAEAYELAGALPDGTPGKDTDRARIAVLLAPALIFIGGRGDATRFAQAAAADLPPACSDAKQALTALGHMAGWIHLLPPDRWLDGALPPVEGDGLGARMLAVAQSWERCVRGVDRTGAVALARFATAPDSPLGLEHDVFVDVAGIVLLVADDSPEAFYDQAREWAHRHGVVQTVGLDLWRGAAFWQGGRLREARQSLLTARLATEEWGSDEVGVPYTDAFLVRVDLDAGDVAGARRRLDARLGRAGIGDAWRLLQEAHAAVLLSEGSPVDAVAVLDRLDPEVAGLVNPACYQFRSLRAQALAALGRRDEALGLMVDDVARARAWGAVRPLGRLLGQLGRTRGGSDGVAELREAVDLLGGAAGAGRGAGSQPTDGTAPGRLPAWVDLAKALAGLARSGAVTRDEQVDLLQHAVRACDAAGAAGLRRAVCVDLERLGAAVPVPPRPVATLVPEQRRMASQAAAGADVLDIAAAEMVTPGTVEQTLADVRRRLGVRSDAELAAALGSGPPSW